MDYWIPAKAGIHRSEALHCLSELIEKLRMFTLVPRSPVGNACLIYAFPRWSVGMRVKSGDRHIS